MRLLNLNTKYLTGRKSFLSSKYVYKSLSLAIKNYTSASIAGNQIVDESKQEFIAHRLDFWEKLKLEYDERLKSKQSQPIQVKLPYGRLYEGLSWQSTPLTIFQEINKIALKTAIIARVNNELWDLNRPLERDCEVELLMFDNQLAKTVLWHSSAHVLASVLEKNYGCELIHGPATDSGFFYDVNSNGKNVCTCRLNQ